MQYLINCPLHRHLINDPLLDFDSFSISYTGSSCITTTTASFDLLQLLHHSTLVRVLVLHELTYHPLLDTLHSIVTLPSPAL